MPPTAKPGAGDPSGQAGCSHRARRDPCPGISQPSSLPSGPPALAGPGLRLLLLSRSVPASSAAPKNASLPARDFRLRLTARSKPLPRALAGASKRGVSAAAVLRQHRAPQQQQHWLKRRRAACSQAPWAGCGTLAPWLPDAVVFTAEGPFTAPRGAGVGSISPLGRFELHPSPALGGDWLQPLLPVPLGCAAWLPSLHSSSSSLPPKAPGLGRAAAFSCGGQELSCLQLAAALEHSQLPLTRGSAEAQAPAVAARDAAPSCGVTWIFQPCPKPLLTAGLAPTPGERGTARRCPPACPRQLPSLLSPAPPEGAQPAVPVLLTPRGS